MDHFEQILQEAGREYRQLWWEAICTPFEITYDYVHLTMNGAGQVHNIDFYTTPTMTPDELQTLNRAHYRLHQQIVDYHYSRVTFEDAMTLPVPVSTRDPHTGEPIIVDLNGTPLPPHILSKTDCSYSFEPGLLSVQHNTHFHYVVNIAHRPQGWNITELRDYYLIHTSNAWVLGHQHFLTASDQQQLKELLGR